MAGLTEREDGDITYADMKIPLLEPSKIQQFFTGTNIFVTGATGFLGKLIMEKLLRVCYNINNVYILVREKKGKTAEKRFEELLDNVVFDRLKREQPKFLKKIKIVTGDCALPNLGLSLKDQQILIEEIHCVFHCAATVRFDEKIRNATNINVRATRDILALSKEMKQLKSVVYVSTAYSHCIRDNIDEVIYECNITGDTLLTLVDTLNDEFLDEITPTIIGKWPNTYAFTKAIAEDILKAHSKELPVAIVRPSIVIATAKEPVAGWIDNMYGATGVTVGVALGLIRTLHCKQDCLADLIPADFIINCVIAAAWQTGTSKLSNPIKQIANGLTNDKDKEEKEVKVYNYVSSIQNPITWRQFMKLAEHHLKQLPSPLQVWHYCFILTSNYYLYLLCILVLHRIPAYIVDFMAICIGKKPLLVKGYQKIDKFLNVLAYFSTRQWIFSNKNTQELWKSLNKEDQRYFDFNIEDFDWDIYFQTFGRGGRVYLLKDPMETLPQGRIKYLKLQIAHYTLVGLLFFGLLKLLIIFWSIIF